MLKARGYVFLKDYTYLRDTTWANLKRATVAKSDENRKTGSSGKKLTEIDEAVLDIIGKTSATIVGMDVPEPNQRSFLQQLNDNLREEDSLASPHTSYSIKENSPPRKQQRVNESCAASKSSAKEEYYKALLHKCNSEIFELETKLNVEPVYSRNNGLLDFYGIDI